MHKVKWDILCQPKQAGGLGIKSMQNFNNALLAKQTWRVLTSPDSTVVRLLRSKYMRPARGTGLVSRPTDSATWKGIVRQSSLVDRGKGMNVYDGKDTLFWEDKWVGNVALKEVAIGELQQHELRRTVSDYWNGTHWDWQSFQHKLPATWLLKISARMLCTLTGKSDCPRWLSDGRGEFTVQSAYGMQVPSTHLNGTNTEFPWRLIWKLHLSERQRMFAWFLAHDRILTKTHLIRRGLSVDMECPMCGQEAESPLHLFRDCLAIIHLWRHSLHPDAALLFFQASFREWVEINIRCTSYRWEGLDWNAFFVLVCWWIWHRRNEIVHHQSSRLLDLAFIKRQVEVLRQAHVGHDSTSISRKEVLIGWSPPPPNWVKLNTDGASRGLNSIASCGGVLRDSTGGWIKGFSANLGHASAAEAEMWGVFYGLSIAWSVGFRQVIVALDSTTTLTLLQQGVPDCHPLAPLVTSCRDFICRDWVIRLDHTFREGNRLADWLAGFGSTQSDCFLSLPHPPRGCMEILWEDLIGVSFPRNIPALFCT